MQNMQNAYVLRQLAAEREAQLRRATVLREPDHSRAGVRRRLGESLVRLGAWVGAEPSLRADRVGAR